MHDTEEISSDNTEHPAFNYQEEGKPQGNHRINFDLHLDNHEFEFGAAS
jgi:hypothetical protein